VTLAVFGAHASPSSRSLGAVIDEVRRRHVATVGVVWRHYPDPAAHPRAAVFASDVASAVASGVTYSPALFVDATRMEGEIEPGPVLALLDAALRD
jgi:hypothetical protein